MCGAQRMSFKDKTFDKIFSICVLEHIPNDTMVLKESFRILKPNRVMVLSVPRNATPFIVKLALRMPRFIKNIFASSMVQNAKNERVFRRNFDKKFRHYRNYELGC